MNTQGNAVQAFSTSTREQAICEVARYNLSSPVRIAQGQNVTMVKAENAASILYISELISPVGALTLADLT